ncbi:GlcG/HbpS family heme-binding protein [Methylocaldum sp.]|uniref:GlcG/HbpS family heme-binding protein n=1 Tax=Methylocaldum sp. TaxID=1969727 RepID=UPI002D40AE8B|nr:heme-binding protein [Methylocaldum sp.]HYE35048.1 heme-binding protein [Methylocaldum sp.]
MSKINRLLTKAILASATLALGSGAAFAACNDISRNDLENAANAVVDANSSGGFNLPMWVTVVDETGKVCHVVNTARDTNSGPNIGNDSWLGSRVISAQKASTANAFSLNGFAISTANLYGLTQPDGSLYGLQHSNPIDAGTAYNGSPNTWGKNSDPLKNKRIGGVNVFGGGLALYNAGGVKVGAIGVSGDTSCTDHAVAWKIRTALGLDHVPAGFHSSLGGIGDELHIESGGANTGTANDTQQPTCPNPPAPGAANGVIADDD